MKITPKTRLFDLLSLYPFLADFLAAYNPKFSLLRNPVLRNTLGRTANLSKICTMGGNDLSELAAAIAAKIKEKTGQSLPVEIDVPGSDEGARKEILKGIIRDLHAGVDFGELKKRFRDLVEDVDASEIAEMEEELVKEGMPREEIKRLCDVHVEIFRDALDKKHAPDTPPGHPVNTYMADNRLLEAAAQEIREILSAIGLPPDESRFAAEYGRLSSLLDTIGKLENHYIRKENELFPYLERHGITGPPHVMWAVHDDIRALLKDARAAFASGDTETLVKKGQVLATAVIDMAYKEDNILFPMALEILTDAEWAEARRGEDTIGYALAQPGDEWKAEIAEELFDETGGVAGLARGLPLDTGLLTLEQVNLIMRHLPVELSYVDENDTVRYYTENLGDKIFPRSPGAIGRKVQNCHPPESIHIVNRILDEFRSGSKDVAEFWIPFQNKFVHIRYFAVRDAQGKYRGSLEVVQDVTPIRALAGERRLLDW
ncbi:MAG: DUF438 domain-containing protein [bacterium]|jgi:hypothetical protein